MARERPGNPVGLLRIMHHSRDHDVYRRATGGQAAVTHLRVVRKYRPPDASCRVPELPDPPSQLRVLDQAGVPTGGGLATRTPYPTRPPHHWASSRIQLRNVS